MTHAQVLARARQLDEQARREGRRVAVLSTCNLEFLRPYLAVAAERHQSLLHVWLGPFNQLEQPVLDAESALWRHQPEMLVVLARPDDFDPRLCDETQGIAPEAAAQRLDAIATRLLALVRAIRERFTGPILLANFALAEHDAIDPFDASRPEGLTHVYAAANRKLSQAAAALTDVHVLDYAGIVARSGAALWRDERLWHMARVPVGATHQAALADALVGVMIALLQPAAKCIVVDLDNTLWGGVLGDDGVDAILLGDQYPGSAFKRFQSLLASYRRRGFLLAIASKNDEKLVYEALDQHPEMLLRSRDFAAIQANWEPKPLNLQRIAEQLNIGLDSLVFVDDNPVERAAVRHALPMVRVVELPGQPFDYTRALTALPALYQPRLSAEDGRRAEMYAADVDRRSLAERHASVDEFLADLGMVATVGTCEEASLARVHQLIQKTNQFNLTTRRYSLEEVRRFASSPEALVVHVRVRDRFGDAGLVAVAVARRETESGWRLDSVLMSCRVMGRKVEHALLAYIGELVRLRGASVLRGEYVRSPKNHIVEHFYVEHGFTSIGAEEPSHRLFELKLSEHALPWPAHIRREAA